jgi:uncharacterized protein YxeA
MKTTLATLSALLTYANAIQITQDQNSARFERWTQQFNRSYKSQTERQERLSNWLQNDAAYAAINSNRENTFTVGHN